MVSIAYVVGVGMGLFIAYFFIVWPLRLQAGTFLEWFEDNMAGEQWFDNDAPETDPNYSADGGVWRDYTELPEYINLKKELHG